MAPAAQTVYVGVGSNLGDRQANCICAVERMDSIGDCEVDRVSDWFMTSPVGHEDQDWFVNGVVALWTRVSPRQFLSRLLAIEKDMGRVRAAKWGPRVIDLDILLFGREVLHASDLTVPHPRMHMRRFVLVPMVQLSPDLIHPGLGETMTALLQKLGESGQLVSPIKA